MYYAKQLEPWSQSAPLFHRTRDGKLIIEDDFIADHFVISNDNSHYLSYYPDMFKRLTDVMGFLETAAEDYFDNGASIIEVADYYFGLKGAGPKRLMAVYKLLKDFNSLNHWLIDSNEERKYFIRVLNVMTGQPWSRAVINGCSQSEWKYIYYDASIGDADIDYIEACYFNTGTEFSMTEDIDTVISDVEALADYDMCGGYYCVGHDYKEELAHMIGTTPDNITVFTFGGYRQVPEYNIA